MGTSRKWVSDPYRLIKLKKMVKTLYSDFSNGSDGAGHVRRDDLNTSREAADTTLNGSLFYSQAVLGKKLE